MGWVWKGVALLVAVMLFGVAPPISLLIFAFVFLPAVLKAWGGRGSKGGAEGNAKQRRRLPLRNILGGLLLVFALAGYFSHGAYSPIVFGFLGALLLLWGRVSIPLPGSGLRPVEDSIVLRSSLLPFSWAAVAEIKPITRDVGRALAGVTGTVLLVAPETPSIYAVVEARASTERSAEAEILDALRDTALGLSPLGAYLLPLDSVQAQELLQPSLEAASTQEGGWSNALASGSYDLVAIRQEGGFARSLGLYRRLDKARPGPARVPSSNHVFAHPPFLIEVYKAAGNRIAWPRPDQYTAFLSSLLATKGEPIGTRILDAGAGSQAQMVMVKSQSSPPVELSRAQLRAVVKMYDEGTR